MSMLQRNPLLTMLGSRYAAGIRRLCAGIGVEASRNVRGIRPIPRGDLAMRSPFGRPSDLNDSGRVVGEFEHQTALILGVNEPVQYHPQTSGPNRRGGA